jgi:orotate phosphoribosyltransferase
VFDRNALIDLIRRQALEFGHFTLASGKTASFYLDCRRVIGNGVLDQLGDEMPDAVGGMAIGADPITGAVITVAATRGMALKGFIVRKEAKAHGKGRDVEGPVQPGQRCVIVEDVVTTGGSSLLAIERVEAFGMKVQGVIAIVDRLEGGADAFRSRGYDFQSLVTIRDLGIDA